MGSGHGRRQLPHRSYRTYAQKELGDLVFVNLPQEGDEVEVGSAFGDVESVNAVSDVYSPVSGVVCAINEELLDHPENITRMLMLHG